MGIKGLTTFLRKQRVFDRVRFVRKPEETDSDHDSGHDAGDDNETGLEELISKLSVSSADNARKYFKGREPLIVDANSLIYEVSAHLPANRLEIDESERIIRSILRCIRIWRSIGFEPILLWDGGGSVGRGAVYKKRRDNKLREALEIDKDVNAAMSKKSAHSFAHFQGVGHWATDIASGLSGEEIIRFSCYGEADSTVSTLGMVFNAYTCSNDSDILLMSCTGKGMIPIDSWSFLYENSNDTQISCCVARPEKVLNVLGLKVEALPLFASLCCNDYVSIDMLSEIGTYNYNHFSEVAKVAMMSLNTPNPFIFPQIIQSDSNQYSVPPEFYDVFEESMFNYILKIDPVFENITIGKILDDILEKREDLQKLIYGVGFEYQDSESTESQDSESTESDANSEKSEPIRRIAFRILNEEMSRPSLYLSIDHIVLFYVLLTYMEESPKFIKIEYRIGDCFELQLVPCSAMVRRLRVLFDTFLITIPTSPVSDADSNETDGLESVPYENKICFMTTFFGLKDIVVDSIMRLPKDLQLYALLLSCCPALWTISKFDIFYILAASFVGRKETDELLEDFEMRGRRAHRYLLGSRSDFAMLVRISRYTKDVAHKLCMEIRTRNLNCVGMFLTDVYIGNGSYVMNIIRKHVSAEIIQNLQDLSQILKTCNSPFSRQPLWL